eukprot:3936221-Rhodomonas_salina.3
MVGCRCSVEIHVACALLLCWPGLFLQNIEHGRVACGTAKISCAAVCKHRQTVSRCTEHIDAEYLSRTLEDSRVDMDPGRKGRNSIEHGAAEFCVNFVVTTIKDTIDPPPPPPVVE